MVEIVRRIIHGAKQKILNSEKVAFTPQFDKTIFRNDDVSFDTDLEYFKKFCETFHKFGYIQLHGVVLYGNTNVSCIVDGVPTIYKNVTNDDYHLRTVQIRVANTFIGDNKELIDYLNEIPDEIALHGLYHSDYSLMTYKEQDEDIRKGLSLLHELFPQKTITTFIAPFNHTNEDTFKVCEKYGLRVSAEEGEHLEDMIAGKRGPILKGQLYRYHHHRFYPDSLFTYYDLSIEILKNYLLQNAFTYNSEKDRSLPSLGLLSSCVKKNSAQSWYEYAFREFETRKYAYYAYKWIKNNVRPENKVLEVACGGGGMLYHLYRDGFSNLYGYDYDENAIDVGGDVISTMQENINFYVDDAYNPQIKGMYDTIVWINGMYHLDHFSLDDFFDKHVRMVGDNGYFIFDMIDSSFNNIPQNEYCTQDWNKEGEKRPSEYKIRMSKDEVIQVAKKYNASLVKVYDIQDIIPRKVYIFTRKQPNICLLCDRPNWAYHNCAIEIKKLLNDEFKFDIQYVIKRPQINRKKYDAILVFFWGETSYREFKFKKSQIIKEVSSHRWEDDPAYGPCTPKEFCQKYLFDASTVICPSMILYRLLEGNCPKLFLCSDGFSPDKFYYTKPRQGAIKLCMVGNLKDPVKGVEDILKPAAEGFNLELAQNLKHEELREFYNRQDVYVVSSRHESNPLPLIESMACGCFPVSSKVGIAPELIRHKENGYLVSERTVAAFREAFDWCEENLEYIRMQGRKNAEEMYNTRRWELMSENYRKMFRAHLSGE